MLLQDVDLFKTFDVDVETSPEVAGDADIFFTKYMEQVLNKKIQQVMIALATETMNQDQLMFYRGTLNGFLTLRDWFLEQKNAVMARHNQEEK